MPTCIWDGKEIIGKAVMLQEDAHTTHLEEKEGNFNGWGGTPVGENGMHYMLFHPTCFPGLYDKLFELEKRVSCMFYIGDVGEIMDALSDEDLRRDF